MTNREYLDGLLQDKEKLFQNIAVLSATGDKQSTLQAIDDYMILEKYWKYVELFIDKGILDGEGEKQPV